MINRKRRILGLLAALFVLVAAAVAFLPNSAPPLSLPNSPVSDYDFDGPFVELSQLTANLNPLIFERRDMSDEERQRIVENRNMLTDLRVFRLGTSVYVRQWSTQQMFAMPLGARWDDIGSTQALAPFVMPRTGKVYLPGAAFPILPDFFVYRDHSFLSQTAIETHTPYQVHRLGDFLVVSPEGRAIDEAALLSLIEQIFSGI